MEACAELLVRLGATPREAAPWLYRMLWRSGMEARPPLYAGILQGLLLQGIPFAALWTLVMKLTAWRNQDVPAYAFGLSLLTMALVMTLTSHWALRRTRKRRNLPDWESVQALAAERIRS
jgi:hypothetical protein